SPTASSRAARACGSCARASSSGTARSSRSSGSRTTRARWRPASSAASGSPTSKTSSRATSSRPMSSRRSPVPGADPSVRGSPDSRACAAGILHRHQLTRCREPSARDVVVDRLELAGAHEIRLVPDPGLTGPVREPCVPAPLLEMRVRVVRELLERIERAPVLDRDEPCGLLVQETLLRVCAKELHHLAEVPERAQRLHQAPWLVDARSDDEDDEVTLDGRGVTSRHVLGHATPLGARSAWCDLTRPGRHNRAM